MNDLDLHSVLHAPTDNAASVERFSIPRRVDRQRLCGLS
jgi:hypothetical protein